MLIRLNEPFLSIRNLEPVELPDFTVLTGENGSGKTHLLRSIDRGHCVVDGVATNDIAYFDHSSMAPSAPQGATATQLDQMVQNAFQQFQSYWRPRATQLLHQKLNQLLSEAPADHAATDIPHPITQAGLDKIFADVSDLDDESDVPAGLKQLIQLYKTALRDGILHNDDLEHYDQNTEFSRTVLKSNRPLHKIGLRDFREHFAPSGSESAMYRVSLGFLFSKYKIDEFQWCHDQFETNNKSDIKSLRTSFRRRNARPWTVINKLLKTLGDYSNSDHIFRFRISDPESVELRLSDYNNFSFSPRLINQNSRAECDFTELSSGEKTLLALALAIYGSMDGYKLPKVLLLDEIDASLHPSMVVAMIYALQTAFIEKGVKVLLATHSPTTVAVAPDQSVFVMGGDHRKKVVSASSKSDAIELLTEGFVTLEEGLQIRSKLRGGLNILTEGKNLDILKKLVDVHAVRGVHFIEGLEDRSGKEQLKAYFDLLCILDENKTLVVFDCDAASMTDKMTETGKTFFMSLPKQVNPIVSKGIENMFSEALLEPFTKEIRRKGVPPIVQFDEQKKSEFATFVMAKATRKDFKNFQPLLEKIEHIKRLR